MNSGEVGSVVQWLTLKVSEPLRATTGRAAEAVRKPHALLRGDWTRAGAGALQASHRASYTWIRHISILRPTCYVVRLVRCQPNTQHSRSRPPVCDRPSRPSRPPGAPGAALFALLLVIPCKASSCVSLRLAPDFYLNN